MQTIKTIAATVILAAGLTACSQSPDGSYSLRQSIADAIAPGAAGVSCAPSDSPGCQAHQVQAQGGQPAATIALPNTPPASVSPGASQVTVTGGQVKVATGGIGGHADWRPHDRVDMVVVQECGSVMMQLARTDKTGVPAVIFVSRVQGVIYVGAEPGQGCSPPYNAVTLPAFGRLPLSVPNHVSGATVQISPAGY